METLNLPPIEANIKEEGEKTMIFDSLRGRYVALTPEEWVRQHFVGYLINHLGYPSTLIANEMGIELNGMQRRCDTVVYNREMSPLAIVEYKAPSVAVNRKTFEQAMAYNNVLRVPYIIISNGLRHYCCHIDYQHMTARFLPAIPQWQEISNKLDA